MLLHSFRSSFLFFLVYLPYIYSTLTYHGSNQTYFLSNPTTNNYNDTLHGQSQFVRIPFNLTHLNYYNLNVYRSSIDNYNPIHWQISIGETNLANLSSSAYIWVESSLCSQCNETYTLTTTTTTTPIMRTISVASSSSSPMATFSLDGNLGILSNDRISVYLTMIDTNPYPLPWLQNITVQNNTNNNRNISYITSQWNIPTTIIGNEYLGMQSIVTATGPLFVETQQIYLFRNNYSAKFTVRLEINRYGPLITEQHQTLPPNATDPMAYSSDLILHAGWNPTSSIGLGWAYCDPNNATNSTMDPDSNPLIYPLDGPIPRLPHGALGYLQPRWSQACDSKYYFGAWDDNTSSPSFNLTAGILAVRSSQWNWPQYRGFDWYTMINHTMAPFTTGPDTLFIKLPLYGMRTWYLLVGPREYTTDSAPNYYIANSMQELDRLYNVYDLDWPGLNPSPNDGFCGQNFLGNNTDPTHPFVRHNGQALLQSLTNGEGIPNASQCLLSSANIWCDPDWYGAYVGYASPENPNFFSDFSVLCMVYSLSLVYHQHPRSDWWCNVSWGIWEYDLRHSVTLQSGATQESPGYAAHALQSWMQEAPLLDRFCPLANGTKAVNNTRYTAAINFLYRTSQPWAFHFVGPAAIDNGNMSGRWVLPLGDTHPTSTNYTVIANMSNISWPNPTVWSSEEIPGFGAILQTFAGTANETFFAFKASPNRGHNHGDQLSFHYAAYGARIVIDIMAGYNPRPYQEYWHNRLCFGTNQNLDGYEQLIGYKTTTGVADVAIGQVVNNRLQTLPAVPPDAYLGVYPVTYLSNSITYRRTVLLVQPPHNGDECGNPVDGSIVSNRREYLVLIDAHNAFEVPEINIPAYTTLTFFQQDGMIVHPLPGTTNGYDMGNGTVWTFAANKENEVPLTSTFDRWNWPSEGNENATRLTVQPTNISMSTQYYVTILCPDGSTMIPPSNASLPTVIFDAANNSLTMNWNDGLPSDVLNFTDYVINASSVPVNNNDNNNAVVTITRGDNCTVPLLLGNDVSISRSQGDISLSVTDAGYTFGEIPDWAVNERIESSPTVAGIVQPSIYPWPPRIFPPA